MEIKVPIVSTEGNKKGVLVHWYKKDGEFVKEGEEIAELMLEKLTLTVKSPATGKLKIIVKENEEISEGKTIGIVEI